MRLLDVSPEQADGSDGHALGRGDIGRGGIVLDFASFVVGHKVEILVLLGSVSSPWFVDRQPVYGSVWQRCCPGASTSEFAANI